jgi:hypothetical protein
MPGLEERTSTPRYATTSSTNEIERRLDALTAVVDALAGLIMSVVSAALDDVSLQSDGMPPVVTAALIRLEAARSCLSR